MIGSDWKEQRKQILKSSNDNTHELTIESIEQAFIQLLQTNKLQDITISDIARRAGVSRTAFYKNYQTKEDVVSSILNKKFSSLLATVTDFEQKNPSDKAGMFAALFTALKDNNESVLLCSRTDCGITLLAHTLRLMTSQPRFPAINSYYPYYIAGAYHNVIIRWMETGMQESPEEMAQALIEIESFGGKHLYGGI